MTDVESKTPNKRKSLPAKQVSGKKSKLDKSLGNKKKVLGKTPSQQNGGKIFQNKKSPEQQNLFNKSVKKPKKNSESENSSGKKAKSFAGTATLESSKGKKEKLNKNEAKQDEKNVVKKKKRSQFYQLKAKAANGDKDVVKTIEDKIKAIKSRGNLTKTATRKLRILKNLKNFAEGKVPEPQKKELHTKSDSTKRRERKKKVKSAQDKIIKSKEQPEVESDEDVDDAEDSKEEIDNDNSDEEVNNEDSSDELEGSEEEGESVDEENSDESEDESEPEESKSHTADISQFKSRQQVIVGPEDSQKDNVTKNRKRYVLFIGNISYDTNKNELSNYFEQCGDIKDIRIPKDQKTNKPRGFAYVELGNENSYQKCLSLHHSFFKGRRINVLYTKGGKKMGNDTKKEIKAKNFKLHAMRKQGQLLGSKKETQKRSFRRNKQRIYENNSENK